MQTAAMARKEHQRLRWRLLYGQHKDDIRRRMVDAIGKVRQAAWGPIDMTSNPFLAVWSQAAATYRTEPTVLPPPGGEDAAKALADSGHWSLMQRVQRDTLGLREMVVRIEIDADTGTVYTTPVAPYLVDVDVDPRSPYTALAVTEERPDPDNDGEKVFIRCDPEKRVYAAYDKDGRDVSERVLGGSYSGDAFPFTGPTGAPLLPYVTFRAALTGSFWDSYTGIELVETSLQLGVLYSFYMHCTKDSSWPQRYAVDLLPHGGVPNETPGVMTDPATLLLLQNISEAGTSGTIGQWAAASDPASLLTSIQAYERRAVDAALGTANVSRANSDIRSAASLVVSRDDQRELQRSYEPVFRRSDVELMSKVSALLGGPEDGWRIEYKAIPRSPDEQGKQLDSLTKAVDAGLTSKVDAYMALHPQMSRDEAEAALTTIAQINRQFA